MPENLSLEVSDIKSQVDALSYDLPIKVDWKGIKGQLHVWKRKEEFRRI